jgi:hypothetical protein
MKKTLSILLATSLVSLLGAANTLCSQKKNKQSTAEKVKARIVQLGFGNSSQIRVKRKDGTKLSGYVAEINDNDFVIADPNTGNKTSVLFDDVKEMKGKNSSTGASVSFGAGDTASIAEFAALIGGIILVVALAIPK